MKIRQIIENLRYVRKCLKSNNKGPTELLL